MNWNGKNTKECDEHCKHVWILHSRKNIIASAFAGLVPEFRHCEFCGIPEYKSEVEQC